MKKKNFFPFTKRFTFPMYLTCCLLFQGVNTNAQSVFFKIYGDIGVNMGFSVKQTSDSGFIICGSSQPVSPTCGYLVKTNSIGDTLWTKMYCDSMFMDFQDIQVTSANEFLTTGTLKINTSGQNYNDQANIIMKTDVNGDTLWTHQLGGPRVDIGYSMTKLSDGNLVYAGLSYDTLSGWPQLGLTKTDPDGNMLWEKKHGGAGRDYAMAVDTTLDGGFILTGTTDSYGAGDFDIWLVKTDGAGDTLWTKTFGGSSVDYGNTVKQTPDGGFIIGGCTMSFGSGFYDAYILKTDSVGNLLWSIVLGTTASDILRSSQVTPEGNYVFTGSTGNDVLLIKTDTAGNLLWQKTYGNSIYHYGSHIELTSDGGYVIAGYTLDSTSADIGDVFLIKTDSLATGFANRLFTISTGLSEPVQQAERGLLFSPNPFSGSTLLTTEGAEKVTGISIYDLCSRLVLEKNGLSDHVISIESGNLLPGMYLVVVRFSNGTVRKGKLVLNR